MKKLMSVALVALFSLCSFVVMAQPPQGEGQQRGNRGQQQTVEQRVETLKKQLKLTDEQCAKIIALEKSRDEQRQGRGQRTEGERPDREAMMKQMKEMQEKQKAEMKKILTAEQYAAWEKLQAKRPQGQGQGQGRQRQ